MYFGKKNSVSLIKCIRTAVMLTFCCIRSTYFVIYVLNFWDALDVRFAIFIIKLTRSGWINRDVLKISAPDLDAVKQFVYSSLI